jgi:hypothetical protein
MWPLRAALSSWRRSNQDSDWRGALEEIITDNETRKVPLSIRKAVSDVVKRLELISSGHAECPVPKNENELLVWWATEPPK